MFLENRGISAVNAEALRKRQHRGSVRSGAFGGIFGCPTCFLVIPITPLRASLENNGVLNGVSLIEVVRGSRSKVCLVDCCSFLVVMQSEHGAISFLKAQWAVDFDVFARCEAVNEPGTGECLSRSAGPRIEAGEE
jgi:hypothetical protein